jgi:hypothetical protein
MQAKTIPAGAQRIPLRRRDGTVRAYVLVDPADHEWLTQWRWSLSHGYARRDERRAGKRRVVYLHRAILGLERGDPRHVDHRNRDPLDCRRANLRIAQRGHKDNQQNQTPQVGRTSRYRGVCWNKRERKWAAQAGLDGKHHHLGWYADEHKAAAVAAAFRAEHMPFSEEASP